MLGPNYNDFMLLMNDEHKNIHVSFLHNVSTKWWNLSTLDEQFGETMISKSST
jgi:hypothetical protein